MWDSAVNSNTPLTGSTKTFDPSMGPHVPKALPVVELVLPILLFVVVVVWLLYRKRPQSRHSPSKLSTLQTNPSTWLDSSAKRICLIILLSVVALVVIDYCIYIYPDLGLRRFSYRSALYIDCIFGFDTPSPRCGGLSGNNDYTPFPRTTYGPFLLLGLFFAAVGLYWDRTWGALLTRVSAYTSRLTTWIRVGSISKETNKQP